MHELIINPVIIAIIIPLCTIIMYGFALKLWRLRCKNFAPHKWVRLYDRFDRTPRYVCKVCYAYSFKYRVSSGKLIFRVDKEYYKLPASRWKRSVHTLANAHDNRMNRYKLRSQFLLEFCIMCDDLKIPHAFRIASIHDRILNGD